MSTKEAITILSRALAIYFLAWLLSDLTYLPGYLLSVWHYESGSVMPTATTTYWRASARLSLSFHLLRILILFFAVQWFYRSGPSIHGYFLAPSKEEQTDRENA